MTLKHVETIEENAARVELWAKELDLFGRAHAYDTFRKAQVVLADSQSYRQLREEPGEGLDEAVFARLPAVWARLELVLARARARALLQAAA